MPKSRKKKTRDFQKVKLKVGKKLPKGDNVTNLSFKTKQIHLTQRIKEDGGQDLITKKKLNVQDLLRQCDHHSSSARVNAISGLKELWLDNHAELMVPTNVHGYGEILKKLSTLLIDNEAVVRHSVINMFKVILNKLSLKTSEGVSSDRLDGSLYSHIHAYLCCAMNHVHEDIKLDALVVFDILLDTFPHLMIQQTGDLLKNLVGLIASPAYLGPKGNFTTQRLSLNPDSKLPAMKFRARVLTRMKRTFMEAVEDLARNEAGKDNVKCNGVWSLYRDHDGPDSRQDTCFATDSSDGASRFSLIFLGGSHELDDYIMKPSSLEAFLQLSVPVLLQCWKEANTSMANSDSDNIVSADSVEVMSLVACVIQLMFVVCASHQRKDHSSVSTHSYIMSPGLLVKHYQRDFENLLFRDFPYSVHVQMPDIKKKKRKQKSSQFFDADANKSSLVSLNLALCDIMSTFCADQTFKPKLSYLNKMETHIVRFLQKSPSVEQSKTIARILKNVFMNPQINASFTGAYTSALKYYLQLPSKSPQKLQFYNLFACLGRVWDGWERGIQDVKPVYRYKENTDVSSVLEEFFQSLPQLLLDVISSKKNKEWVADILTFMSCGHVQNCSKTFHDSFRSKLSSILDPETGVLSCCDEHIQKKLFLLLSQCMPLNEENFKQILTLIRRPVSKPLMHRRRSCSVVSYAICSIASCILKCMPLASQVEFSSMTAQQHGQLSDFLRFMFSLQIGMTGEELDALSPQEPTKECTDSWFSVDFTVEGDQWDRHVEIASLVARELTTFYIPAMPAKGYHQNFTFFDNIQQLWLHAFANRSRMHILSAYSLIKFIRQASYPHVVGKPGPELYQLASCAVASLLTNICCPSSVNTNPDKEMVWQIKSDVIECLATDANLLNLVVELLANRSQDAPSEAERESSKTAQDFLLLNEEIKLKLTKGEVEEDMLVSSSMDTS